MLSLFRENLRIAFDSIKSQLLRTIITVLIIAFGIMALVGILGLIGALQGSLSENFADLGANTFSIQRFDFNIQNRRERRKVNPPISYRQVKEFIDEFSYPSAQTAIAFTGTARAEVKFENEKTDPEVQVLGVNESYLANSGLKLDDGRDFTPSDISNNAKFCIIGSDFRKNIFKNDNPIGKTISVRGNRFKVIGILEEKGSTFGSRTDLRVFVPIQTARTIFTQPNINYELSIKVGDAQYMDAAQDQAILTFRNVRNLSPIEKDNFGLERSDDLLEDILEDTKALNIGAWVISILTIFGSCIALLNIMLVSVTERTREIGVRKALGAKKSTIAFQFLYEAIIVGQIGGVLGILLGLGITILISTFLNFSFAMPWNAVIAATLITFFVAIISGLFPALKAAKLDPVESLRYE